MWIFKFLYFWVHFFLMFVEITCIASAVMTMKALILSSIMLALNVCLQCTFLTELFRTYMTFPFSTLMNSFYVFLQTKFCVMGCITLSTAKFKSLVINSKMNLEVLPLFKFSITRTAGISSFKMLSLVMVLKSTFCNKFFTT